ncbi:FmdB family transcriptional regulator [Acaricomes phytoseiuli]|uniref:FmdB family zinc ribbon protein n=2 Tax=Acaricomes phytoseiuli TaxID=291968 RepID=UPI0004757093|nr:FmdB family zinc ribbon protein [Acaricomes phytoseiuli]MCW1250094.1 FmdB family transcriptional regulator [Acaricomes phytoseiuli]
MPMYAYACKDCGHDFDIHQAFTDDALTVCPECGGTLRKKFNSVGVSFKGSGFYSTDSRASKSSGEKSAIRSESSSKSTGSSDSSAASSSGGSGSSQSTSSSSSSSTSSAPKP